MTDGGDVSDPILTDNSCSEPVEGRSPPDGLGLISVGTIPRHRGAASGIDVVSSIQFGRGMHSLPG